MHRNVAFPGVENLPSYSPFFLLLLFLDSICLGKMDLYLYILYWRIMQENVLLAIHRN